MSENGERTEKATSRHRKQARDKGQFAYSQELTSAMTLAVTLTAVFYSFRSSMGLRGLMQSLLDVAIRGPQSEKVIYELIRQSGIFFLMTAAPILAAAFAASLAGSVIQGLPRPSPEAVVFKWDQLSPVRGFSKLKAKLSWIEWGKILVFVVLVTVVVWTTLSSFWNQLASLPAGDIYASGDFALSIVKHISGYIAGTALLIGVADYFYQRWRFEKNIMQTKAEVKQDMKATEGNPQIRGRIRSIQREQARRRMMTRLKDADVIVTNPTHYAVALEYKPETMAAPRVVAKGQGWLAQKIKAMGRVYDIATVENVPLARALYRSVDLEQDIPAELYKAVAEVLAYVYRVRNRM